MSKEFLDRCPEIIHEAEAARAAGQYKLASSKVRGARADHPRGVVHLENSQLSDLMRAWRIDVVANTSLAKRSWNGEKAVTHLRETQDVIKTYYNYPAVQHRVPEIKYDNEGNPYDFEVEMLRDRAKYCLAAAALTGDFKFTIASWRFLNEAISQAKNSISLHALLEMEAQTIKGKYSEMKYNYEQVFSISTAIGNFDRARWAARTYFGESLKRLHLAESLRALRDLGKVRKNPVKIFADVVIGVVRSSEILSAPQRWVQRKTLPKYFKAKELKLEGT